MQQENGGGGDDNDRNYVRILIGQENGGGVRLTAQQVISIIHDNWNQEIHTLAIYYIIRAGREFGFNIRTIYRAVIYLDRFIASRIIFTGMYWQVRLLALTCLSLCAKVDESRENVPRLSGSYNFNVNDIRRMEFLVLDEFNWNMHSVTPFEFTNFFISRFCRDVTRRYITRMRTNEIIMRVLRDVRLMYHRPSVIAAAATLLAVNTNFTRRELQNVMYCLFLNGLQIDNACYCYYRLREMNQQDDEFLARILLEFMRL